MIVVGIDFSESCRTALRWAVREARLRRTPVLAVHASPETGEPVRHRLHMFVRATTPAYVGQVVVAGRPATTLIAEAAHADLLVVGRRGGGTHVPALHDPVLHDVVRRAPCPVAVVPPDAEVTGPPRRVVVGTDGSGCSTAAVRWAATEAVRHRVTLVIAHAVAPVAVYAGAAGLGTLPSYADEEAGCALVAAVAEQAMREAGDDLDVVPEVTWLGPAAALQELAGPRDLLVVGTHGRGRLARLLLGSTSAACVEHCAGPVVVVPPGPDGG